MATARTVQPRKEHLLPLRVSAGAAQGASATRMCNQRLLGRFAVSSHRLGR